MGNISELEDSIIITEILNKAFMTVAKQFNFTIDNVPRFPAFMNSNIIENQLQINRTTKLPFDSCVMNKKLNKNIRAGKIIFGGGNNDIKCSERQHFV